jgi:hypothetical protein
MTKPPSKLSSSCITMALAGVLLGGCTAEIGTDEQFVDSGPRLVFDEYEVLFTNPVCQAYAYDEAVISVSGEVLEQKPQNAFCYPSDKEASGARPESPQHKLIEWIADPTTEEIFFASMSFSNGAVQEALCDAVSERNVKVRFVLDSATRLDRANKLLACEPASGNPADGPELHLRGHEGNISLHHNKLFLLNPGAETMRIAFGSGNISSGLVLHHENWHFITLPSSTHFAQAHLCLMDGVIDHGHSKSEYSGFIRECKESIPAREEGDAKALFVPGEGGRGSNYIINAIRKAEAVDILAHRFTHSTYVEQLRRRLTGEAPPAVRLVSDDDMYWVGQGQQTGGNEAFEYDHVTTLTDVGMEARYVETNHPAHLLHHNKVMVFDMPSGMNDTVFCGAGNFTKSAFKNNYENFYYISIPHVIERYREQYEHLYGDLATAPEDMPAENVIPSEG